MPIMQRFSVFVAISLVLLGQTVYAQTITNTPTNITTKTEPLPVNELRTFVEVFERIKSAYVEPIDDKTLMDNAIKGMVSNLDPHSAFLDENSFHNLEEITSGQFGGLGIEIEQADDFIRVVTPIDGSPADKAGVKAGDFIVKINDTPTKDLPLNTATEKMRGKLGEKINLTLVRDKSKPFVVTIIRAKVQVLSVKSKLLEKGYGYIRIAQFQTNTGKEVGNALNNLKKNSSGDLKGVVLDLRNNPGGVLQEAVATVNQFVNKGLIVYTKGRMANTELHFYADGKAVNQTVPLVVLINNGSASAAEIVAGSLQDSKRAVIMGTTSFGKGSVQTILPVNKTEALKLTTALYYTPKGRSIQAQGIVPDVVVEQSSISQSTKDFEVREADLNNHLNNGSGGKDRPSSSIKKGTSSRLQVKDYQLNQAIALLKGLNIVTKTNSSTPTVN